MGNVSKLLKSHYRIKIYLLGGFRISNMQGVDITPKAVKARCILAILVLSENAEIARDKLTQLLWSRHAQEQARTSLRQSLSLLRRTFKHDAPDIFTADRYKVYLNRENVWIDSYEIINNATELLDKGNLINICSGTILDNLNVNETAFKTWLDIEKQALSKNIQHVLHAHLSDISESMGDSAKKNTIIDCLRKIDPSHIYIRKADAAVNPASIINKNSSKIPKQKSYKITTQQQIIHSGVNYEKPNHERDLLLYRNALLKKVMLFWIDGVLEQSLFKKVKIELQLTEHSEHVFQACKDLVKYSIYNANIANDGASNKLRNMTEIGDIFTELGESMIILGAPGSGKTTLLLTLAQTLVNRAETDTGYPVPVVFHLSTWANQRFSLEKWFESELEQRYQMPGKLGAELIKNRCILPLMDGLDEVDERYRLECVDAINYYRQRNTWLSIVVCCREDDYKHLSKQVMTTGAVQIQAMTENICNTYLQTIEKSNKGLNAAIVNDNKLKGLLTTPLMLNIASIAYENFSEYTLPRVNSPESTKDHLFTTYTQTMLKRRLLPSSGVSYSKEQTCRWLSWLARSLDSERQSIFYLDSIQPYLVNKPLQYWVITQGSVIICALITGITLGLLGGIVTDLKYSLGVSLSFGVIGGYIAGLMGYGDAIRPVVNIKLSWAMLCKVSPVKQMGNLVLATCFGLGVALVYGFVMGIALGMLIQIFYLVINSLDFEADSIQKSQKNMPNEGILLSLRNVIFASAVGGLLGGVIGLFSNGLQGAIVASVLAAILSGLFFGGHTCIQHYLLRFYLWRNKYAPLNYIRFLEFAVERVFLYRVGGGYIFIHRSLAEYFAKKP